MRFLIHTDGATKVVKECTEYEARAMRANGFVVEVLNDDGSTSPLGDEPGEDAPSEEGGSSRAEAQAEPAPTQRPAAKKKAAPAKVAAKKSKR